MDRSDSIAGELGGSNAIGGWKLMFEVLRAARWVVERDKAIKGTPCKFKDVYIFGYSRGGPAAALLAVQLQKMNIPKSKIQLLGVLDPVLELVDTDELTILGNANYTLEWLPNGAFHYYRHVPRPIPNVMQIFSSTLYLSGLTRLYIDGANTPAPIPESHVQMSANTSAAVPMLMNWSNETLGEELFDIKAK